MRWLEVRMFFLQDMKEEHTCKGFTKEKREQRKGKIIERGTKALETEIWGGSF